MVNEGKLNRREFLKVVTLLGASAAVEMYKPEIVYALETVTKGEVPVAWIQGAACTGCTVSFIQTDDPDLVEALTWFRLNLMFHPTIMIEPQRNPKGALKALEAFPDGGILIVEGAVPRGKFCTIGHKVAFEERLESLSRKAKLALAFGTCASFGGIPSGYPNPTGCRGVEKFFRERRIRTPVIKVSGCPPHPDWMLLTIALVALGREDWILDSLDEYGRPVWFYPDYIHNLCPRRQFFDNISIAEKPGEWETKCLWKIGCRGPIAKADCPIRLWNEGTNFCISANSPCIGCTHPEFPGKTKDPKGFYEHVSNPILGQPKVFSKPFTLDLKSMVQEVEETPLASGVLGKTAFLAICAGAFLPLIVRRLKLKKNRVKEAKVA